MAKYVWYNSRTGEFGKSYTEKELKTLTKNECIGSDFSVRELRGMGGTYGELKLIKYDAVGEPNFEFPKKSKR